MSGDDRPDDAHTLRERDLRAHPYLWIAAKRAYERGRAEDRGSFYEFMTCIVFCAFTFEAYVNWLVWKFWDKEWNDIHERSNLETKLTVINDRD